MVEFGKQLGEKSRQEWKEYYLDYSALKKILKKGGAGTKLTDGGDKHDKEQQQTTTVKKKNASHSDFLDLSESFRSIEAGGISDHIVMSSNVTSSARPPSFRARTLAASSVDELPSSFAAGYLAAIEFRQTLDQNIEKLVLFLLRQEGESASQLYQMSQQRNRLRDNVACLLFDYSVIVSSTTATTTARATRLSSSSTILSQIRDIDETRVACISQLKQQTLEHRSFAQSLLDLFDFVELNVTALRKILKKHDKNLPHHRLSATYFRQFPHRRRRQQGDGRDDLPGSNTGGDSGDAYDDSLSHLDQLYHYGGLNALFLTLRRSFEELHQLELNLLILQTAIQGQLSRHKKSQSTSALPMGIFNSDISGIGSPITDYGTVSTDLRPQQPHPLLEAGTYLGKRDDASNAAAEAADQMLTPIARSRKEFSLPDNSRARVRRHSDAINAGSGRQHPFLTTTSARTTSTMDTSSRDSANKPFLLLDTSRYGRRDVHFSNLPPLETTITKRRDPILDKIRDARNRLQSTTRYAEVIAAQALIEDEVAEGRVPESAKVAVEDFTSTQRISSFLNLMSTFLYMTNYYVVAPTVGDYAVFLGQPESMAGIIIGMTPNAALVATVLYGWWSNHSYKHALVFAATSSVMGNIFYALALSQRSLTMLLVGRFLNGFGSARSINRRYIADAFSKADRTAASADFVTSGALGMAAGPGIAFLLGHLNYGESNPLWSSVTAPGWVMLGLWSIFLISSIIFFVDPDRSHLYSEKNDQSPPETISEEEQDNAGNESERQPLIIHGDHHVKHHGRGDGSDFHLKNSFDDDNDSSEKIPNDEPLCKNIPVMMTLWLYFVLKLALELLLSSSSTVTRFYFGWQSSMSGLFLAILGLLMFPANMIVAKLSQQFEDREMILASLGVLFVSAIGIMNFTSTDNYSVYQYILFAVGVFISTNSMEGPNMGLLSKTIPKSWARGIFNSGFLATEAGTLARSVGDIVISSVAESFGVENLLDGLFLPMAVLSGCSLLAFRQLFSHMIEADDDEDDTASYTSADSLTNKVTGSFSDYDTARSRPSTPNSEFPSDQEMIGSSRLVSIKS